MNHAGPVELVFRAIDEDAPGPKLRAQFERCWPSYREWFLREGEAGGAQHGGRKQCDTGAFPVRRSVIQAHAISPVWLAGEGVTFVANPSIMLGTKQEVFRANGANPATVGRAPP